MTPPPRSPQQRKQDALSRLEHDADAWVATADAVAGTPYLVPLSFYWDGAGVLIATPAASQTGRNLRATGKARLGIGPTRDVLLIEGTVRVLSPAELTGRAAAAYAAKAGWDPRKEPGDYRYFLIQPQRMQAWREENELRGRDLMRDGRWLVSGTG